MQSQDGDYCTYIQINSEDVEGSMGGLLKTVSCLFNKLNPNRQIAIIPIPRNQPRRSSCESKLSGLLQICFYHLFLIHRNAPDNSNCRIVYSISRPSYLDRKIKILEEFLAFS